MDCFEILVSLGYGPTFFLEALHSKKSSKLGGKALQGSLLLKHVCPAQNFYRTFIHRIATGLVCAQRLMIQVA